MNHCLLTAIIFTPAIGALLLYLVPGFSPRNPAQHRHAMLLAMITALVTFLFSIIMLARFDVGNSDFQMIEQYAWVPTFGISYAVLVYFWYC
jgi:NADH-quinone oxidoreductase subunit M